MRARSIAMVVLGTFGGIVVLAAIVPDHKPDETYSVGWLSPGASMSGDKFNSRAGTVVYNTDWTKMEGAATYDRSVKLMFGANVVMREMAKLGTQACPDLAPLYSRWLAAGARPVTDARGTKLV